MAAYSKVPAYLLLLTFNIVLGSKISNLRLCADKKCEEVISHATTLRKFSKMEPEFLSFKGGQIIKIMSKSAGNKPEYWEGMLPNGKRGYFPKGFVKEFKVDVDNPEFEIPTEDLSIEAKLGLQKNAEVEQPPADSGGGDDTEIDDTEISDEDETREDPSPSADVKQEEPPKKEEVQDDTDLDDTDFDLDDDVESDDANKDAGQPVTGQRDPNPQTEEEDDTEFGQDDEDDFKVEIPDVADDDFLLGMEDLDKNFFDLHENFDDLGDMKEEEEPEKKEESDKVVQTDTPAAQTHDNLLVNPQEGQQAQQWQQQNQEQHQNFDQQLQHEQNVQQQQQQNREQQQNLEQQQQQNLEQQQQQNLEQQQQQQQQDPNQNLQHNFQQHQQQDHRDNHQQQHQDQQQHVEQNQVHQQQQHQDQQQQQQQEQHHDQQLQQNQVKIDENVLTTPKDAQEKALADNTLHFQPHHDQQQMNQQNIDQEREQQAGIVDHQQQMNTNQEQQHKTEDASSQPQVNQGQPQEQLGSQQQVDPQQGQQVQDPQQPVVGNPQHEGKENTNQHMDPNQQKPVDQQGFGSAGEFGNKPMNLDGTQFEDHREQEKPVGGISGEAQYDTGVKDVETVEEISKSQAPKVDGKQEETEQQDLNPTSSEHVQREPMDIAFTPGNIGVATDAELSSSMEEQVTVTASVPTPGLDAQESHTPEQQHQIPIQETQEPNPRHTVIDGTTIPLFDEFDDMAGLTSPQELSTTPSASTHVEVDPTETKYTPDITDLPFVDEPPGFQYTQNADSGNEEPEVKEKEEENVESEKDEDKHEEASQVEGNGEKSILELPVNDTDESKEANIQIEPTADQMYHSDDFISRKPLSVGQGHPPANQGHVHKEAPKQPDDAEKSSEVPNENTQTTTSAPNYAEIPAPPLEVTTIPPAQEEQTVIASTDDDFTTEIPPADDPYETGVHLGRHFNEEELEKAEEEEKKAASGPGGMGRLEGGIKSIIGQLPPSIQSLLEQEPLGLSPTFCVLMMIATLISFVAVSLCTCLCGSKKVHKKDPLVVVREIEEKLFVATKEKENLEDELQQMRKEKLQIEKRMLTQESSSGTIQTDLQNTQLHNEALKKQIVTLQEQVDDLSSQLSSNKNNSQSKDKQVKDFQKQISKLEDKNKKMEEQLEMKTREVKDSAEDMKTLTGQIKSLTQQVKHLETSKQQLLSEADDWKEKVDDLKERQKETQEEMKQLQETVDFKDNEMEVLRDCFRQLKALEGDGEGEEMLDQAQVEDKIQKMMDVSRVNASLYVLEEERDSLSNRLQIETDARKEVEDQLAKIQREMDTLQADKMKADRQSLEAQTKLNVLSNYFKEKEAQLQRELGEHEALKKQNVNKLENIDEHAKMMEEEVEMYKAQIDGLKRELASSERDFRSQIAANEKKAHENWLAARAAERELKEVRHDAGVLRQKLTELERRQMGPGGLIRPLPTRGLPPPGMMNGPPPPPGMERSPSRGSIPPPHLRDDEFRRSPHERLPPPPDRRPPPPGARLPPHGPPEGRSPPPGGRMPPPMPEGRSPPPFDRRPPHPMDRRTPPYRPPHPDMMPSPRGPPPFNASSPPPRMPPPHGVDPRMGPRTSSPHVRPPPPGRDGRPPRQHSQV